MTPAEIVLRVTDFHVWKTTDWAWRCACGTEATDLTTARAHVAEKIAASLADHWGIDHEEVER